MKETLSTWIVNSGAAFYMLLILIFSAGCVQVFKCNSPSGIDGMSKKTTSDFSEKTYIRFCTQFSGERVLLRINGREFFSEKLKTMDAIGLAREITMNSKSRFSILEISIPELKIGKTVKVDWKKGKLVAFGLYDGEILVEQLPDIFFLE